MKKIVSVFLLCLIVLTLSGCFSEIPNRVFGDQHFKTAIALIELHKTRFGDYPNSLNELKYIGEWDRDVFYTVRYKKLDDGYELDLTNGWIGVPKNLRYPADFWKGLGLKKSNLKR